MHRTETFIKQGSDDKILDDGYIHLIVPSSWVRYYSGLRLIENNEIIWNQFNPPRRVSYKRISN
ncbi:hypothetical protein P3G55_06795 [Leptospira sp. 96542]|nr:hypothetical protein [Leptospira sp. 96542]